MKQSTGHRRRMGMRVGLRAAAWGLTVVGAVSTGAAATAVAEPAPFAVARPSPPIRGMWVWKAKYITDATERRNMLAFCQRQGFNRLLVQVPWKPGTAQVVHKVKSETDAPSTAATHPEIGCPIELAQLVAEAAQLHIAVEALDGAPFMGDAVYRKETLATVDAVLAFNRTLPAGARFVGLHWDIEPYVRPDWKVQATRPQIELDYIQTLVDARRLLAGSGLTLAVDIPMWYDNKTAADDNCTVTFDGQTRNFHEFIQDHTDYVGIMSYRQRAVGPNSIASQVATELAYAERIGKWVCPAFETIELKETPQITFFGKSAEQLQAQRKALDEALAKQPGFGGTFLHCYPAVRTLLEPDVNDGSPAK